VDLPLTAARRFWPRWLIWRGLRLLWLLPLVSAGAFALVTFSPVDPVRALVGEELLRVSPEQRPAIESKWGLNDPAPERFAKWAGHALQGDLGQSMIYQRPVADVLMERASASLALMGMAWLLAGTLGFGLGMVAGVHEGGWLDRAIRGYAFMLASAPTFWLAIVLLNVFAVVLAWAPTCCAAPSGLLPDEVTLGQRLQHLVLPAIALGLLGVAQVTLHTRDKVREVLASDYATLAYAQGATRWRAAWRHALRNAALPAITLQFAHLGELFGGSLLAETVFSYPGLGQAVVQAGTRADAPLLLGIAVMAALFVFTGNALADALLLLIDPRQRSVMERRA
jgi:peptide/nickel transport system permease protein